MKLAVSILSSNYDEEETIQRLNATDAEYLHLDIMDGHFVMDKTPEREFLHLSNKPLDVHLMVSNPFSYISKYAAMHVDCITISFETDDDKRDILEYIQSRGIKCGLAIKPETNVCELQDYLEMLDEIVVMTVEPGKGGQKMLDGPLNKISKLMRLREEKGYNYKIVVDGGVNEETIEKVKEADMAVVGSYVCKSEDFQAQIDKLRL